MQRLEGPDDRLHELRVHGAVVVVEVDPARLAGDVLLPLRRVAQDRAAAERFGAKMRESFETGGAVDVTTVYSKNVVTTIENYMTDNDADLLVMTTKNRNVIEKMFHKSVIKRICADADFPILVFHN